MLPRGRPPGSIESHSFIGERFDPFTQLGELVRAATDTFEQAVIRLNVAVALARLADWSAARDELLKVSLPEQSDVGNGTVQYLLALAAENLGHRDEAEAAFKLAAASDSLLTENGPPVKELAEARLLELQKTCR